MVSWPVLFDGNGICAETLLREYPQMVERIEILKSMLNTVRIMGEDEIIEQHTLARKALNGVPTRVNTRISRTEDLAIKMDVLRRREVNESTFSKRQIAEEIRILRLYIELYEVIVGELTEDERLFLSLHYQQGISLRRLAQGGVMECAGFTEQLSLYRLQKMRTDIIRKVEVIIGDDPT